MKYLLIIAITMFPIITFASEGNSNFWGWVWYSANFGTENITYSWKLYNEYSCTLLDRYDYFMPVEKRFYVPANTRENEIDYFLDLHRVYCKVRYYQCSCIYK